jgi:ATP-dependent Clp protease ATP-binding subunit ClpC
MMDNGMIKLANGKDVSFRDAIIIFTSNEGTKDLELKGNGIGFGEPSKEEKRISDTATVMKALEKKFRPEFRGRLTGVTVFNSLGEPEMMKIFDLELNKFKERLKKKGYSLTVGKELKKYIVSKTDTRYGARDLTKGIGTYIEDKIVEKLLDPGTDLTKKKIKANLVSDEVEITIE